MAIEAIKALQPLKPLSALKQLGSEPDLDTSDGLYSLAYRSGLQKQADDIVKLNSGEEHKKFFAGGFISDVFDVLNVASYGMVGVLKGKGFTEGIKNRESFSDQDALGRYGLIGTIGGMVLDIATDPFMYVSPWKIMTHVPGFMRAGKAVKDATLGKKVIKEFEDTENNLSQTYESIEGGIPLPFAEKTGIESLGRLVQKFVHGFGQDPVFIEILDRRSRNIGIGMNQGMKLIDNFALLDTKIKAKVLEKVDTGVPGMAKRIERVSPERLQRELSNEDFSKIAPVFDKIKELSQEQVRLGMIPKELAEKNIDTYVQNRYKEYELAAKSEWQGPKGLGVTLGKGRVKELTQKKVEELGQIENPEFLLGSTMVKMIKDIEDYKLQKAMRQFASDKPLEGFSLVPDTKPHRTSTSKVAERAQKIGVINEKLKPFLKGLKGTFKADKNLSREYDNLVKSIESHTTKEVDELTRYFNEGAVTTKSVSTSRRIGTISDKLTPIANAIKKYDNYDDMYRSADGIELEKLNINGILDENNFKSMKEFFDYVKNPYKAATEKVVEDVSEGSLNKIVALQKKIAQMTAKSEFITDIQKRSINDSFLHLERNINDLRFKKSEIMEEIELNKLRDLAGKYIPTEMKDYIDEIVNSKTPFGARLVGEFKFMKVPLSPAAQVRNVLSNLILNWWKLGIGPWRLDLYAKAVKSYYKKDEWYDIASDVGMDANTYVSQELHGFLNDADITKSFVSRYGTGAYNKVKKFMGNLYESEEGVAKLAAFKYAIQTKGLGTEEAWKVAESATFNYAQVTPFVRHLRTAIWGVPFITFPLKAIPVVVETALKNPHRISFFAKFRNGMENLTGQKETEEEKKNLPAYMRDGFFMKLPMKDSAGRSMYFDLTYIVPFGSLLDGSLFERPVNKETGLPEGIPATLLSKAPILNLIRELANNKDFFGNRIVLETDPLEKQGLDLANHVAKTFTPPWLGAQLPGGYNNKGERMGLGETGLPRAISEGGVGQKPTFWEEMGKYAGLRVTPLDEEVQSSINEFNKKKGLQRLLLDNGLVSDFSKVYQPK